MTRSLGEVRKMLEGLPDSTEVLVHELDDPEFVIIVDSKGNAKRIMTKRQRFLLFGVSVPVAS